MTRFLLLAGLVTAKALIGHDAKPVDLLFETVEVLGVFAAGVHAAHYLHRKEGKDGN